MEKLTALRRERFQRFGSYSLPEEIEEIFGPLREENDMPSNPHPIEEIVRGAPEPDPVADESQVFGLVADKVQGQLHAQYDELMVQRPFGPHAKVHITPSVSTLLRIIAELKVEFAQELNRIEGGPGPGPEQDPAAVRRETCAKVAGILREVELRATRRLRATAHRHFLLDDLEAITEAVRVALELLREPDPEPDESVEAPPFDMVRRSW